MKLFTKILCICIVLIILGVAAYSYFVEPRKLEVNRFLISEPSLKGIKIVFAADFHIKPYQTKKLEKIVDIINAENPDLVVSTGDYVCGHTRHSTLPIEKIAEVLGKVQTKYGFYTTLGNHDGWYGKEEITSALEKNGIKVLSNNNILIKAKGKNIYIAGLEDYDTGKPDIFKAISDINGAFAAPVILLTHSPDMFKKAPENITLTLAGHTHGGQVRLPFINRPIFTASKYGDKYAKGWKREVNGKLLKTDETKPIVLQKGIKTLFVTRGIGVSILPFRFNCPPEINVFEFE
ncbi:MAG: metallophosphoesterase [Candidatus Gastranaerophilales bacterium]|nr:metallophosphoesterase [Candidatus Gastranaerophilales bacterium]